MRPRVGPAPGPGGGQAPSPGDRYRSLVPDFDAFREASLRPLPTCILVNTLRVTPEELETRLRGQGWQVQRLPWYPRGMRLPGDGSPGLTVEFLAGAYHVQEEVSLLPVALLDPQPGERILDLCAAPGNKTAQAAVHMDNRGTVVANDPSVRRLSALQYNLQRLGVACSVTLAAGGGNLPPAVGPFDRVLVDAPCSCEGTSRKHPHVRRSLPASRFQRLAAVQRALLTKALQLCRPGGRVVYSTCTYAPEENEGVVDAVLRRAGRGSVRVVPVEVRGLLTRPGVVSWEGQRFAEELAATLRIYPQDNDTGGFFVAVLEKLADTPLPQAPGWDPPAVELAAWRRGVERFGIDPEELLSHYVVFRANARTLGLACRQLLPPAQPRPTALGLPFVDTAGVLPRLTTPAALLLAPWARGNVVELEADQADAFLARRPCTLHSAQVAGCEGPGAVLVRWRGLGLGGGVVRREPGGLTLYSAFPTAWAVKSGRSVTRGRLRE